jgi:hypothetical protein
MKIRSGLQSASIVIGTVWAFLLAENVVRYIHGWGQNGWTLTIGLLPVAGLLASIATIRLARYRPGISAFALAVMNGLVAALYLFGAETGVVN